MLPEIKHNTTNWIDGMKINKFHFINSENALFDFIRDATATRINNNNYGLLAPLPNEKKSLELIVVQAQSSNFKLNITTCRAVTAGGCRIEITANNLQQLACDTKVETSQNANGKKGGWSSNYLAIITVNPFNRQPSGQAEATEFPLRQPNTIYDYQLSIISEEEFNASDSCAFHLPVARFKAHNLELVLDNSYIPPCSTIKAHGGTINLYNSIAEYFSNIQSLSSSIAQKVIAKAQNTPLAQNIKLVCEKNVWQISENFFLYRNSYHQESPINLLNVIVQLANSIKVTFSFIIEKEKEEVLQYFKEWNDMSPAKFDDMLNTVIDLDYNHLNIAETFAPAITFLQEWDSLLQKLNELELIGRKKQKDLFVRQMDSTDNKPKGGGRISLLD